MAQVVIKHPDGRRFEVSEKAFSELYEPFGFAVEGVVHKGALLPATEANLKKANDSEAETGETELTRENRGRAVILSDLEREARARMASTEAPITGSGMINPAASGTVDTGSNTGNATPVSSAKSTGSASTGS